MGSRDDRGKEDIAERIRNTVITAFESMEFGQLNQAIGDTVKSAFDKVKETKQPAKSKPLEIRVKRKGMVSGILFTIFGIIGGVGFSVWTLMALVAVAIPFQNPAGWWAVGVLGSVAALFYLMLFVGIRNNSRIGRLKEYLKELKRYGKTYCELQRLSKSSARSLKYVQKDIKRMLKMGMLPDARMDEQETCLLLDEETYNQYKMAQDSLWERQQEEERRREKEKELGEPLPSTVEEAISHGRKYMETLDRLRESMPNQPITDKLIRLDMVLERLFEALKKHPEQLDEMERFMEYYLPTTVKLVTSYEEFAAVEFPGDNVNGAKREIEKTLDTINNAFEKLLDDFYQDTAFDVLSDASVLQSMLAREGLTEHDFKV